MNTQRKRSSQRDVQVASGGTATPGFKGAAELFVFTSSSCLRRKKSMADVCRGHEHGADVVCCSGHCSSAALVVWQGLGTPDIMTTRAAGDDRLIRSPDCVNARCTSCHLR